MSHELLEILTELRKELKEIREAREALGVDLETHKDHHHQYAKDLEERRKHEEMVSETKQKIVGGLVVGAILGFFSLVGGSVIQAFKAFLRYLGVHI